MKTLNHAISFPSAVGELVVHYNFTEAELNWSGRDKPAEIEITAVYYQIDNVAYHFEEFWYDKLKYRCDILKQAVYTEHMKRLKEREDIEWYENMPAELRQYPALPDECTPVGLGNTQEEYLDDSTEIDYPPEQYEA